MFQNKVIWITGASSGHGEALAREFSKKGAKLIISARRKDKLDKLASELGNASVLPLDLEDFGSFEEKVKQAIALYGEIDIVIHNGAIAQRASVLECNLTLERKVMNINYFSHTEISRLLLPYMLEQNKGHIVVISGILAHVAGPGRAAYAAAKAALIAYFDSLRAELIGQNIDISVIIPGLMQTGIVSKAIQKNGQPQQTEDILSSVGIAVQDAAKQTIEVIENKRTRAYIGLKDEPYQMWSLCRTDPEQGIEKFLTLLASKKITF